MTHRWDRARGGRVRAVEHVQLTVGVTVAVVDCGSYNEVSAIRCEDAGGQVRLAAAERDGVHQGQVPVENLQSTQSFRGTCREHTAWCPPSAVATTD